MYRCNQFMYFTLKSQHIKSITIFLILNQKYKFPITNSWLLAWAFCTFQILLPTLELKCNIFYYSTNYFIIYRKPLSFELFVTK